MPFNGIFYIFVFDLVIVGVSGGRFRRVQTLGNHQYHQDSAEQTHIEQESRMTCKNACDKDYAREFEETFKISYSNRFYEFPLDPLISQSQRKMHQYCQVANRKFECYRELCGFESIPWSTDRHICIDHVGEFRQALNCLNVTSLGAHRECNEACNTETWSKVIDAKDENRYLNRSTMSSEDRASYKILNRQCHFQICQLECRKRLIETFCPREEKQRTLDVIEGYYSSDYIDQLSKMQKYDIVHLFPRLCARLLPEQMKSEIEFNQHSNDRTMKKFRKLAQKAVATML